MMMIFNSRQEIRKKNKVLSEAVSKYSAKLAPKYNLAIIKKKILRLLYSLENMDEAPARQWHIMDLKPYFGSNSDVSGYILTLLMPSLYMERDLTFLSLWKFGGMFVVIRNLRDENTNLLVRYCQRSISGDKGYYFNSLSLCHYSINWHFCCLSSRTGIRDLVLIEFSGRKVLIEKFSHIHRHLNLPQSFGWTWVPK